MKPDQLRKLQNLLWILPLASFTLAPFAAAQSTPPLAFEVASIKPNAANDNRIMIRMQPGGRFTATGVSLRQLISQAYNVRDFQISGLPAWASTDRYDVNAKLPDGAPDRIPPEQLRPLLRALLEERFQLKTHADSKEMSIYELVQAKGGHKMKMSEQQQAGPGPRPQMVRMGRGQITLQGATVTMLVQQLSQQLGRTITDKTGLTERYDVELNWTPDPGHGGGGLGGPPPPPDALPATDAGGPTIFTALQEQLGLRLESAKGPVEMLIIDSASKPTEN